MTRITFKEDNKPMKPQDSAPGTKHYLAQGGETSYRSVLFWKSK